MATIDYIDEVKFKNCDSNIINNTFKVNTSNKKEVTPTYTNNPEDRLKILAINDTFHDLTKDRSKGATSGDDEEAGYDCTTFIEKGPLNYLMTGAFIEGDYEKQYKEKLNSIINNIYYETRGTFENKVAREFEISYKLQTADTTITYDDVIANVTINNNTITLNEPFLTKIKSSNGSLTIVPNILKKQSFPNYIAEKYKDNERTLNVEMLKVSHFIRWYLHGDNDSIPTESMKILSDAGLSFLTDIFRRPGSKVTPYVAVPVFLDSAGTSTSLVDPEIPIVCENLTYNRDGFINKIVPIVSNYFSCNQIFMCYIINEGADFNSENFYCFSLCIFKIPDEPDYKMVVDSINAIRSNSGKSTEYDTNLGVIYNYIITWPSRVARYYFGDVQKDWEINDNGYCGKCGAGVPYIGKVIKKLIENKKNIEINGLFNSPPPDLKSIKDSFNDLKKIPLKTRIPMADSRIFKIFCNGSNSSNERPFAHITQTDYLLLFKILADYKRTGDYQQSFSVLKAILNDGSNVNCYTFSSGDELSALIGRLLGVPTILQTGSTGKCELYRCEKYMGSPEERAKRDLANLQSKTLSLCDKYLSDITKIQAFNTKYRNQICVCLKSLVNLFSATTGFITSSPISFGKDTDQIYLNKISVINCIYLLIRLLKLVNDNYNDLSGYVTTIKENANNPSVDQQETYSKLLTILDRNQNLITNIYSLYENYPIIFSDDTTTLEFKPVTSVNNIDIPMLNIKINSDFLTIETKKIINNLKKIRTLEQNRQTIKGRISRAAESGRGAQQVKLDAERQANLKDIEKEQSLFVYNYNNFIDMLIQPELLNNCRIIEYSDYGKTKQIFEQGEGQEIVTKLKNESDNVCIIKKGGSLNEDLPIDDDLYNNNIISTQTGGLSTQEGEFYDSIQRIVLNVLNKCTNYINNCSSYINYKNRNYLLYYLLNFNEDFLKNVNKWYIEDQNLVTYFTDETKPGETKTILQLVDEIKSSNPLLDNANPIYFYKYLIDTFPPKPTDDTGLNSLIDTLTKEIPSNANEFIEKHGNYLFLKFISDVFDVNSFCDDILFNINYEDEDEVGFLPSLTQSLNDLDEKVDGVDKLDYMVMLDKQLYIVFNILYSLGSYDESNREIIDILLKGKNDMTEWNSVSQRNETSTPLEYASKNRDFINKTKYVKTTDNNINGLYAIINLATLAYNYYGKNNKIKIDSLEHNYYKQQDTGRTATGLKSMLGDNDGIIFDNYSNKEQLTKMEEVFERISEANNKKIQEGIPKSGGKTTMKLRKKHHKIRRTRRNNKSLNKKRLSLRYLNKRSKNKNKFTHRKK